MAPRGPDRVRLRTLAALTLLGLLAACGTRVDEAASTPTSLVVPDAAGQPIAAGGAPTGVSASGVDATGAATNASAAGGTEVGTDAAAPGTDASVAGAAVPASGEPIVLGAVGTRSGIIGAALEGSWRGMFVWEAWVNANGGILGRPVRIVAADDGADPGRHAAAVRRLISEEGVVAFVGNFAPLTLSAGMPTLEQAGIAAIGGDGGEASWFTSPMAFPINGQTVSRARPAAKWGLANLAERKAAVFYVNEAAAPGVMAENFSDEWRRGGGEVVLEAGVSLAQVDFTGEVIRARNAGADLVYIVLEKSACNRFLDAARRQQYSPVWIAPACVLDNALDHRDITTDRLYAAHAARPVRAGNSPAEDQLLDAIATYDPDLAPDGAFMFGWLGGRLLQEALAQPGAEATAAGIVAALNRLAPTTLGGLTPAQSWPAGAHPEVGCGMISRFNGERFDLLTPDFVC